MARGLRGGWGGGGRVAPVVTFQGPHGAVGADFPHTALPDLGSLGMHPAGGPMTLANGWPHEVGETPKTWPHEPGDWHDGTTIRPTCSSIGAYRGPRLTSSHGTGPECLASASSRACD